MEVANLPTLTSTSTQTPTHTVTNTATVSYTPSNTAPYTAVNTATSTVTLLPTHAPLPTVELQNIQLPNEPVANQVVITFVPEANAEQQAAYIESISGDVTQSIDSLNVVVVDVPETVVELPPSPVVANAEPDYYVSALMNVPPNDSYYPQQWALPAINVPNAWLGLPETAPTAVVAVIDSGVCADHPDLQGKMLPGWDYVENDATPQDVYGHGCGVAGIIAANPDNGIGIAGIAPNARILPLRVLDAQGIGTYSNVAAAIVTAAIRRE